MTRALGSRKRDERRAAQSTRSGRQLDRINWETVASNPQGLETRYSEISAHRSEFMDTRRCKRWKEIEPALYRDP